MTHVLRTVDPDGTAHEVELNTEQALKLAAGRAIAYSPRDERVLVDDAGRITFRESGVPRAA